MSEPQPQNFFFFRLQSLDDVKQALADLALEKKRETKIGEIILEKNYTYLAALRQAAEREGEGELLAAVNRELIGFLQPVLAKRFLAKPASLEERNNVTFQLIMLAAATGNLGNFNAAPYSPEELSGITAGAGTYYDDLTFVHTIGRILAGNEQASYARIIVSTLPVSDQPAGLAKNYYWDDAFIFALLLQAAWQSFIFLTADQQQILLQNYFYLSIVAGVPVRAWLTELFLARAEGVDYQRLSEIFFRMVEYGKELVPIDTETMAAKPLAEILKAYLAIVYHEEITTLAQEKFIADIYDGQPFGRRYSEWLREALSVARLLKKGELAAVAVNS